MLTRRQAFYRVFICPRFGHRYLHMGTDWSACKNCLLYKGDSGKV